MFLVLDNFVKSNLVLNEQRDLDIELIDVLLGELILSYMLYYGLAQPLKF